MKVVRGEEEIEMGKLKENRRKEAKKKGEMNRAGWGRSRPISP